MLDAIQVAIVRLLAAGVAPWTLSGIEGCSAMLMALLGGKLSREQVTAQDGRPIHERGGLEAQDESVCFSLSGVPEGEYDWFATHASRFYRHDQYPHILAFVSAIFGDVDEESPSLKRCLLADGIAEGWATNGHPGRPI